MSEITTICVSMSEIIFLCVLSRLGPLRTQARAVVSVLPLARLVGEEAELPPPPFRGYKTSKVVGCPPAA